MAKFMYSAHKLPTELIPNNKLRKQYTFKRVDGKAIKIYEPTFSYKVYNTMSSGLSGRGSGMGSGVFGTGVFGESIDKFVTFIESLQTDTNLDTLTTVLDGFFTILED